MKLPFVLLAGSLALNAALLTGLVVLAGPRSTGERGSREGKGEAHGVAAPGRAEFGHDQSSIATLAPAALRAELQKRDLAGEVVDALVRARIFARYEARRREFFAQTLQLPWWKTAAAGPDRLSLLTPAQRHELHELEAEARTEALRLLGPQALDPNGETAFRHAFVSPEKAVLLEALLRDYKDLGEQMNDETGGLRTAADCEREKFLQSERQRDIAALLTPAELEQFELRTSPMAAQLRGRWAGFQPTEAEYRAVLALHKSFDERLSPATSSSDGAMRPYYFGEVPDFQEKLRATLGAERYAEWKVAGHAHFRALELLAPELGLADDTVKQVAAMLSGTAARSWEIHEDGAMDVAQKRAALAEMARKARAEATAKLGVAAADRYLRGSVAWLEAIEDGTAVNLRESGGYSYAPVDRTPPRRPGATRE